MGEEEARNKEKKEKEVPEVKEVLALGVGSEGAVLAQGSAVLAEPLPSTSGGTSSGAKSGSSGSLMEQLAARGIVVVQKEAIKDCNNMKEGESQDSEESTDDEGDDEEEEEDSGEEDDLEEEEEEEEEEEGDEEDRG